MFTFLCKGSNIFLGGGFRYYHSCTSQVIRNHVVLFMEDHTIVTLKKQRKKRHHLKLNKNFLSKLMKKLINMMKNKFLYRWMNSIINFFEKNNKYKYNLINITTNKMTKKLLYMLIKNLIFLNQGNLIEKGNIPQDILITIACY